MGLTFGYYDTLKCKTHESTIVTSIKQAKQLHDIEYDKSQVLFEKEIANS